MKYGISNLSIIPMRHEASDQSEMVNQILFGEHFKILESRKKWSKIRLAHDSYEGWICNKQWIEIEEDNYKKLDQEVSTITTDILDIISKDLHQPIVIGSILPSFKSGHAIFNTEMYQFDGLTTPGFTQKDKLIENALIYLNAPYLWGGRSPLGIDCSGLTQMVYRLQGVDLPRDAYQQAEIGTTLSFVEESEPGDLAFFDNNEGKVIHVGIIMENNYIIHASGKVRIDRIDQQGIFNKDLGKHTHKLRLIKSIC
ncbi:MAG: hydrolase Nlp/P60 [Flavobacteriales bacterium]|nr:hydrolase Nlp/P60 [Flavobacteriales bacterium]|tara:strand:+ start:21784 stop:22548 length:765 start_codon:yes stop_codon:yes gene_type:complete